MSPEVRHHRHRREQVRPQLAFLVHQAPVGDDTPLDRFEPLLLRGPATSFALFRLFLLGLGFDPGRGGNQDRRQRPLGCAGEGHPLASGPPRGRYQQPPEFFVRATQLFEYLAIHGVRLLFVRAEEEAHQRPSLLHVLDHVVRGEPQDRVEEIQNPVVVVQDLIPRRPGLHALAEHVLELEIDSRPFRCVCAGRIGRCQEVAWRERAQRRHGDGRDVEMGAREKGSGGAPLSAGCSPGSRTFFQTQPAKMTELSVSKQRGKVAQHIPAWRGRQGARFVSVKSEESEPCTGHVCESGIFPGNLLPAYLL